MYGREQKQYDWDRYWVFKSILNNQCVWIYSASRIVYAGVDTNTFAEKGFNFTCLYNFHKAISYLKMATKVFAVVLMLAYCVNLGKEVSYKQQINSYVSNDIVPCKLVV